LKLRKENAMTFDHKINRIEQGTQHLAEEKQRFDEFYLRSQSRIKGMKEEMKEIADERRSRP